MPRYFFETSGGVDRPTKAEADLPDVRAAEVEAVRALGELLTDDGTEFWTEEVVTMTVADETGLILFRLDLSGFKASAVKGVAIL